jgi:hypothetical protein
MANEAVIFAGLQITNGDWHVPVGIMSYNDDVVGIKGPTPGALAVSVAGVNVDLSQLTTPGWCKITNLDPTNFIEWGVWDPETTKFYPVGEIPAGKWIVFKFSRNVAWEYGAGTGTSGPETNVLRLRADTAACNVSVEAYEA